MRAKEVTQVMIVARKEEATESVPLKSTKKSDLHAMKWNKNLKVLLRCLKAFKFLVSLQLFLLHYCHRCKLPHLSLWMTSQTSKTSGATISMSNSKPIKEQEARTKFTKRNCSISKTKASSTCKIKKNLKWVCKTYQKLMIRTRIKLDNF